MFVYLSDCLHAYAFAFECSKMIQDASQYTALVAKLCYVALNMHSGLIS